MKNKEESAYNELLNKIAESFEFANDLAKQASLQYEMELHQIITGKITDEKIIENLFDRMLDFAFHPDVLEQYKSLCRYYLNTNPSATVHYIQAYREMWDS